MWDAPPSEHSATGGCDDNVVGIIDVDLLLIKYLNVILNSKFVSAYEMVFYSGSIMGATCGRNLWAQPMGATYGRNL